MMLKGSTEPLMVNIKNTVASQVKRIKSYESPASFSLISICDLKRFICGFSGMLRIGVVPGLHLGRTEEQVHEPAAAENQQIQPENRLPFGESVLKR
ncbi:hypothetical protein AVEN_223639-1 [Araneus ventricosus]|uniref:Uncharacterized protein n=1 Tax=Araneus ventricosus TaxID=182803 RepID=A0A4Y2V2F9_ARAVE|nr:hypothetical protein AVEN_223639-1 [Araneus ventricosus]